MEYKDRFPLPIAYDFLTTHGFCTEAEKIKASSEWYKSYRSTLKRAKIIGIVQDKGLLESFYDEVWPSGRSDKGQRRLLFFENLLRRYNDQEHDLVEGIEEEEEEIPLSGEEEFARENDLQNYLVKNLHHIEKGLTLYHSEDGKPGIEFYIPGTSRRIDILAVDKENTYVVIELKVSRGYEKVVGQTLYYQTMIKTIFNKEKVRAIIVAREIRDELKAATKFLPDFELFEYQLSFTLERVK
jgi:hypothetical protein